MDYDVSHPPKLPMDRMGSVSFGPKGELCLTVTSYTKFIPFSNVSASLALERILSYAWLVLN